MQSASGGSGASSGQTTTAQPNTEAGYLAALLAITETMAKSASTLTVSTVATYCIA